MGDTLLVSLVAVVLSPPTACITASVFYLGNLCTLSYWHTSFMAHVRKLLMLLQMS